MVCRSTLAAPPPTPGRLNLREGEGGATDSRRTDTRVSRQDYHLLTYNSGKGNVSGEVWVSTQQPVISLGGGQNFTAALWGEEEKRAVKIPEPPAPASASAL